MTKKRKRARRPTDTNTMLLTDGLEGPFSFDSVKAEISVKTGPLKRSSHYALMKERLMALDPGMGHRVPYKGNFDTARDRLLAVLRQLQSKERKRGNTVKFEVYASVDNAFLVFKVHNHDMPAATAPEQPDE